jgi:hypothetical protein
MALVSGCITFDPAPTDPTAAASATPVATRPDRATIAPTSSPDPELPAAGPPFLSPVSGQTVYDLAGVLSAESESQAAGLIAAIEQRTGIEIVVYTQYKPGSDAASTADDAATLLVDWMIGGNAQDGMVMFWNITNPECRVPGNAHVQLYAAPGPGERLSSEKRKEVVDQQMVPWLRYCEEEHALLDGLEGLDGRLFAEPTPTPTPGPTEPPGNATGACADPAFALNDMYWPDGFEWYFDQESVPDEYDRDEVLDIIKRAFDNITSARNDCGLADKVTATWHYRGHTSENACGRSTFQNVVGFDKLPRRSSILAEVCPFSAPGEIPSYAHILINSNVAWSLTPDSCTGRQQDLETTLTHEVGHIFGLDHVGERQHGDLTMSPRSNGACDTEELTLGLGDVLGLEELYGGE